MLKITSFRRLGLLYLIALASIALTIIVSQVLIQSFIQKQAFDSRIINVAGKQRMLSQKISKIALQIQLTPDDQALFRELNKTSRLWQKAHYALQFGNDSLGVSGNNSVEVRRLFEILKPEYDLISNHIDAIQKIDRQDSSSINAHVKQVVNQAKQFLGGMENIVLQYDQEARLKVDRLRYLEFIVFGIALVIIVLELFFLFMPTSRKVVSTFNDLIKSEESAKKMTSEVNKLYAELGKSYQDLESVNLVPEEPSILLKSDGKGQVFFVSEKFKQIMSLDSPDFSKNLFEWLREESHNNDFVTKLDNIVSHGDSWSGELNVTNCEGDLIWLDMYFQSVPASNGKLRNILAIGRDVTEIKEAKQRSREINREAIEKRVKEQQYRSVLILEGQEEERKRISAEIHDGIGQMLTGLKLNLEGITPSSSSHMKRRINDTKDLMKSVIKEVRRVSFNLAPSSLVDFGIVPALKKISHEVTTLTKTQVLFENRTGFINRLDKIAETNLYRIVQEAVNNGIKYAESDEIRISLEHNQTHLKVQVADNGKGFDKEKLERIGHFGASGHGIFNMKERAAYINAQFKVDTEVGQGTTITINLPLN